MTGKRAVLSEFVEIPVAEVPADSAFKGRSEGVLEVGGSQTTTIDSGRYVDSVRLSGDGILVVEGHVTVVVKRDFEIGDRAELRVASGSSAAFYVKGTVRIEGHASVNRLGQEPSRLKIYVTGKNQDFELIGSAVAHAVLENPQGLVAIRDDAQFYGKIRADRLEGGGQIHVDLDCDF